MKTSFYKYHGAGNDFIMIDNRDLSFDKKNTSFINEICNRRTGIGADGVIILENDDNADFRMIYFNADGNESTMCGNGGRCIVAFAKKLEIINEAAIFIAIDGLHLATIGNNNNVNLQMTNVSIVETIGKDFVLDTGSPHYVKIVENFSDNFVSDARKIRNSNRFKEEGINVNFIIVKDNKIEIRTFERGVEDETLACGTGCVAAAISVMSNDNNITKVYLKALGGNLEVKAECNNNRFENIWLFGPTSFVYKGFMNQY